MKILKLFLKSIFLLFITLFFCSKDNMEAKDNVNNLITLPKPTPTKISLDEAIKKRRTVRTFNKKNKVTIKELSNILYAMQGITEGKKRTIASAHGLYPLNLYVIANNIEGLEDGIYKMNIPEFKLITYKKGDFSVELSKACMNQSSPKEAQIKIIVTCVWNRLKNEKEFAKTYGIFEAGEASQNSYLMAIALNLNSNPIGGMYPEKVANLIGVDYNVEFPIIVNSIGR